MKKKLITKHAVCCALAAVLLFGAAFPSFASKEDSPKKIPDVKLSFSVRVSPGSENVTVGIRSDKADYSVDDYEVLNTPDEGWSSYDCPRVLVTLNAAEDYYFKSQGSSYFKLSGDIYQFVSAEREDDNTTMQLTVDLKPNATFGSPINPRWSGSGVAKWDKAYKGKKYDVSLYRDDSFVVTEEVTGTSCDFSDKMQETGDYTFRVRTISSKGEFSNWVKAGAYDRSNAAYEEEESGGETGAGKGDQGGPGLTQAGEWRQDANGWWYQQAGGTFPAGSWLQIGGLWYYFNESGYMATGLQNISGNWYYLGDQGDMKTGWVTGPDNKTRYFDPVTGAMAVNTTQDGYVIGADGVRQ